MDMHSVSHPVVTGNAQAVATQAVPEVALVSMPFVSVVRPSIQLGLLKTLAEQTGIKASTFHLNLEFACQIGTTLYERLCRHRGRMFGDWLFSVAAFGSQAPDLEDRFLQDYEAEFQSLLADTGTTLERLKHLRHQEIPAYLDRMLALIPWERFRVVGFTCTFQQNAASFALARRLKERFPDLLCIFGGANFEGEMGLELVRSVDVVDYAVIGEADQAFPAFLNALNRGEDPCQVPGVVARSHGTVTPLRPGPPFEQLDTLPVPDYEEFFARAESLGLLTPAARRDLLIPFESARGCWWGQKQHCTFCGLNGTTMAFRAKTPERVLKELGELAKRYRTFRFEAVDNILAPSYLQKLFEPLVEAGRDYEFFYEVKSNLTRERIKTLRHGGVRRIQPGIESLNTHVLKLMRKGVTGIQNVNTLRWALYYGIDVSWNLLWGFPHETKEDYEEQLRLMRLLIHLQPPGGAGRIWMERYSPIFTDRKSFPALYVRPEASYTYVYPPSVQLEQVAYFFDYELHDTLPPSVYEESGRHVTVWQNAWQGPERPTLTFWSSPDFLQIDDSRWPGERGTYTFQGPLASIYAACSDRPMSAEELKREFALDVSEEEFAQWLADFCACGLMMKDGHQYLSLALPATRNR
ncbi:ribosomal peptide maturation radical SAM protein 1 [Archangium gephyra]|uniref:Radical SAM domain protein n=1 Tax=Archangium gephyra TaxID=48 RepID=A0AAC8Q8X6_9BACT|nr:RiPP maturation radical SAM C-methyltransferase [Archangium gephyra]AKJ03247.1 Radical SAM domain protein [Archangium gephyra]REG22879.1 ribosomal peptide maturation radical SAM protein 1 [Archangium gephyra]